ncbi:MAG: GntR family transcriptional regulator [Planctomycetes bacterium]|nr:GntR family transcriptional regulator [Planctomycetota bacterium]
MPTDKTLSAQLPAAMAGPRSLVIAHLRQCIEAGRFQPGDGLPSERVLATELGVSRVTVRSALAELQEQGWIDAGGGRRRVGRVQRRTALATCIAVLSAADSEIFDAGKPWVEDRYIMALAASVLEQHGYHTISLSMPALRQDAGAAIAGDGLRALVVAANMCDQPEVVRLIADLDRCGTPVVVYGSSAAQASRPAVLADHHAGARALVEWLLARGRRRIACAWMRSTDKDWMRERQAGYLAAMREAGLEPLPLIDIPKITDDDGSAVAFERQARLAAGYLAEHMRVGAGVDALMALNDPQAICLASACRKLGFAPNADVWLAGYDRSYPFAREWAFESCGPLVTVDKDNAGMARRLAELVLSAIDPLAPRQPERIACRPIVVPVEGGMHPQPVAGSPQ